MNRNFNLQLFADGGAGGGASAAPGADGAANGNGAKQPDAARLRELGVPEARIQKHVNRAEKRNRAKKQGRNQQMSMEKTGIGHSGDLPVQKQEKPPAVMQTAPRQSDHGLRSHYDALNRQAQEMVRRYPDFDLNRELDNPTFLKLTAPKVGLSVEDAYVAVHHRELMEAVARGARQEAANAIRSGSVRPAEHGIGTNAPAVMTFDYKNATRREREAFKKQIYAAAARGEKIYPR